MKNLGICSCFLAKLGEVFHRDFFFNRTVFVKLFELDQMLGAIKVEQ